MSLTFFVALKTQVENLFSTSIKLLRIDGGGEFISKQFTEFFIILRCHSSSNLSTYSITEWSRKEETSTFD